MTGAGPDAAAPGSGCLVTVQHGPAGPPVYCFHPLSGSVAVYGPLAGQFGRDRLVRGLQSIGLAAGWPPDRAVPQMACRYAAEIARDAPPAGSVFLGYSLGGILALETARLLEGVLSAPPLLVLVDTDPLYTPEGAAGPWHILTRQTLDISIAAQPLTTMPTAQALEAVRAAGSAQGRLPRRFGLDRLERMLEVCRANERAAAEHVPAFYPGRVHVLRSGGESRSPETDVWHAFADAAVIRGLPVDHHGLLSPAGCPPLAAAIRELLDAVPEA